MRGMSDSAVACLAMVAGIEYSDATMVLYDGGAPRAVTQSCLAGALSRAGIAASSTMRRVYGWDGVPQPAIVCTRLDPTDSFFHWVVLSDGLVFDPGLVAPLRPDHCWRPPLSFISLENQKVLA